MGNKSKDIGSEKYKLVEVCDNPECSECGGGWQVKESSSRLDLQELAKTIEPGECPGCYKQLNFEIWDS